ncbi:hypothetical protein [Actinomadura rifamycini]|uniref:hypothetical protein n=1 Tax=Actinomadura rifamycini TaxID=31962 RepID=UPI0004123510|nr:hypothetical protein [Actinomadura rifamycini]
MEPGTPEFRKKWVTGFGIGVLHALALASALGFEVVRGFVGAIDPASIARGDVPPEVRAFSRHMAGLSDVGLHRWAAETLPELSGQQPRVLLWAAAFAVVVVRLNKHGPPRVQAALSAAAAAVGALGAPAYVLAALGTPGALLLLLGPFIVWVVHSD